MAATRLFIARARHIISVPRHPRKRNSKEADTAEREADNAFDRFDPGGVCHQRPLWDLNGDWDCTLNCNLAGGLRHIIQLGSSINFYGPPSSPNRLGIANWSGTDRVWVPQWQTFANIRRCNNECRHGANVVVFDDGAVWQRR